MTLELPGISIVFAVPAGASLATFMMFISLAYLVVYVTMVYPIRNKEPFCDQELEILILW